MDSDAFTTWLVDRRKLTPKVASDTVSRCRRAETILDQKLENISASQSAFEAAVLSVKTAAPRRNDVLYAMRLFVAFKNPKIHLKRYAFYGDSPVTVRRLPAGARR